MRGCACDHAYAAPATLGEALRLLAESPGAWQPLAGGTDLMVAFNAGHLQAKGLLDLSRVSELKGVSATDDGLAIGSMATFTDLLECRPVHRWFPNLVKSAAATGALAIQNRGTVGGNIANASPAADTPPSLLAYGAEVELASPRGTRRLPYDAFHLGYKKMDMERDELILRVLVPRPGGRTFHFFRKVGTRQALAITKVSLAACVQVEDGRVAGVRIALGSVAPVPARARGAEAALLGARRSELPVARAQRALVEDISPIDDVRSTAHYRQVTAFKMLGQMLRELAEADL